MALKARKGILWITSVDHVLICCYTIFSDTTSMNSISKHFILSVLNLRKVWGLIVPAYVPACGVIYSEDEGCNGGCGCGDECNCDE